MKRVLVTGAANIGKAGVATIVYKWGQNFSGEVIYDYLMQSGLPDQEYIENIKRKGSRVYTIDVKPTSFLNIIKWITKIVKDNKYEVIHINTDSAYVAAAYIYASKKGGIKKIYVHSHCTRIDDGGMIKRLVKTIAHYVCRPYVQNNSLRYLACSRPACEWMFGKKQIYSDKYLLIENGVEPEKYEYNEEIRKKIRRELNVEDEILIGNVGRFSFQKNHKKLIEVFYGYHMHNKESKLLLIGEGELEGDIHDQVKALQIEESVIFLGRKNNVFEYLSAIDVMVMTSRFEGLPVTAVEAQMASLPCVLSSEITDESKFTPYVSFSDFDTVAKYIELIDGALTYTRPYDEERLSESMFNVVNSANKLETILAK